jgi:hypothetical protein
MPTYVPLRGQQVLNTMRLIERFTQVADDLIQIAGDVIAALLPDEMLQDE